MPQNNEIAIKFKRAQFSSDIAHITGRTVNNTEEQNNGRELDV